jgi:MFS family permease
MEILKGMLELAATTYNTTVLNLLLLVAIVIFLELVYALLIGYVGIILGHRTNKNKMARSIVIGFILYFVFQSLTLGLIAIYGLFNPEVMNLINTTDIVNVETIKSVMYAGIGIYIVYAIILYLLGKIYLNKGVNVE